MKNTKEITTGAMLLAIFGAVLLIDRYLSFVFTDFIVLIAPVVIIVFGNMYNFKDGIIFSVALLLVSFILSPSVYSYFYIAFGAVVGNIYTYFIDKGTKTTTLLFITSLSFAVADLCYLSIISPLFLNITIDQYITELSNGVTQILPPEFIGLLPTNNISLDSILRSAGIVSIIATGLMEGVIVHLLSLLIIKRFNIKRIGNANRILELKPIPAYILFACSALLLAFPYIKNETLAFIFIGAGGISLFILAYYGYVYYLIYFKIRYNRNFVLFILLAIVLLFPLSIIILFFTGFLYGAGTLKRFLVIERNDDEQNKTI